MDSRKFVTHTGPSTKPDARVSLQMLIDPGAIFSSCVHTGEVLTWVLYTAYDLSNPHSIAMFHSSPMALLIASASSPSATPQTTQNTSWQ